MRRGFAPCTCHTPAKAGLAYSRPRGSARGGTARDSGAGGNAAGAVSGRV
jgi:hypothetical protein